MQSGERIAAAIGIKAPAVPEGPQPGMGQQKRLHALTQQLTRLPAKGASADDVGAILAGHQLVERNFTTLLLNLKRKRKWRVATSLAEWAYQQEPPLRLTTLQYNLAYLGAPLGAAPRLAVFRQMRAGAARRPACLPPARPPPPPPSAHHPPPTTFAARRVRRRLVQLGDLGGVSRGGRRGGARDLRRDARVRRRAHDDFVQQAIAACAKAGERQRALVLFRAMEASGVERNTVTYTGAINACAEGMQLDKAMTLFTYMEVAGVPRNSVTYAVAINACTRNGQWALGLRLFEEMDAKGVVADTVPRHATLKRREPHTGQRSPTSLPPTTPLLPPLYVRWCTTRRSRRARRGGRGSAGSSCSPRCRRRACGSPR